MSRGLVREAESIGTTARDRDMEQPTPDSLEQELTGEATERPSSWRNRMSRSTPASARIQAVIAEGSKAKDDHAASILAEREAVLAANNESQR